MKSIVIENFLDENYNYLDKIYKFNKRKNYMFPLFVIYENPIDFPGKCVVRLWQINRKADIPIATRYCTVKDTLEECRNSIPPSFYRFGREASDDPKIVETWI